MRKAALILPLLAAMPAFAPAFAQDRPPAIFPTRDVTITYRINSDGPAGQSTMAFQSATRLMRMDMGQQGYLVADQRAGTGFMVMTQQRMIMDMPAGQNPATRIGRESTTARFTREGSDRVANTPCTNWRIEDQGQTARACVSNDGLTLRVSNPQGQVMMEATQVDYAPVEASRFARPAGFQPMQLPPGVAEMMARQGAGGGASGGAPFPQRGTALPPPGVTK
ncbi:DUF4412 domain-containing protein [Rhodovarius lipocyclicus]|uniref:DUF4412 domain-containing protein n=1 Tax=Rhodovarius lipocyclicus TaxID=268410 RepID=UPI00135C08DB|nr:DUF4412 domain-containing protein [Rhodovarius lipocyclicus]